MNKKQYMKTIEQIINSPRSDLQKSVDCKMHLNYIIGKLLMILSSLQKIIDMIQMLDLLICVLILWRKMMTDCKECKHSNDGCYCPPDKYCTAFEKRKLFVRHTFEFKTEEDWKPMTPMCWMECPFVFMIGLGDSCKYLKARDVDCPFVGNIND